VSGLGHRNLVVEEDMIVERVGRKLVVVEEDIVHKEVAENLSLSARAHFSSTARTVLTTLWRGSAVRRISTLVSHDVCLYRIN
jgi:hypothetical protein